MLIEVGEDESPHVNTDEIDEEAQDIGAAFDNNLDSEVGLNKLKSLADEARAL
jgi:hypothetical protein